MTKKDEQKAAADWMEQVRDPQAFFKNLAEAMETGAKAFSELAAVYNDQNKINSLEEMQASFARLAQSYLDHPDKLAAKQIELWQSQADLWRKNIASFLGQQADDQDSQKPRPDRRFKDEAWHQNPFFEMVNQSYLTATEWAKAFIEEAEELDEHTRKQAEFYAEQVTNALSPANFAFTNPEVIKLTLETNGENIANGLKEFAEDIRAGKIRQTDFSAFQVGRNMAVTPGKVVFQNDLIQLIQYDPTTPDVYATPLLIVPPWINKFYILDLNPQKSFIKWAVDQGLTVFVVSWVNPKEKHRCKDFADYMKEGVLAPLDAIKKATGEKSVNAIGYCVGGTLLAASLAYMAAKKDKRIKSATFFTTQVDFTEAGDLLVFVDERQVSEIEAAMAKTGYMPGSVMATAFNMLRSNDLIWSYVVNKYLKGKEPMAFDLLSWNGDSTNLTEANHSFYLRQCYLYNNLAQGKMILDGERLDLSKIKQPVYNLAARDDHIAPLPSVFKLGQFFGGKTRLVVSGSGHIAGVINPPGAKKYQYWLNEKGADTLQDWLKGAEEHPGSWWPDWLAWIGRRSGKKVPARKPGDGGLDIIEDAPGSYVKVKGD